MTDLPIDEHHVRHFDAAERVVAVRGQGYFPVLCNLQDGSLGAVVRGGAPHVGREGRLDWIRSEDGGRTWSKPRVIVDSQWDDRNPALGVMPDGAIVVAHAEASTYNQDGEFDVDAGVYTPKFTLSTDSGATWAEPAVLDTGSVPNGSPYGRIVMLADGAALMTLYQYPSECAWTMRSTDNGRRWADVTMLPGHDETALLATPDQRILAFMRAQGSQTHGLDLTASADGGRTWSSPVQLLKPNQWPADVCRLHSGNLLLTYSNRTGPFGAGAAISRDDGNTWDYDHRVLLTWDCENTDCGYPSTVQLDDGTIVTMHYAVGTSEFPGLELAMALRYTESQLLKAMED